MKTTKVTQFTLLALITVGVFASMAKNGYGFTLIGLGCAGLALLYLGQVALSFAAPNAPAEKLNMAATTEVVLLSVLLILFSLRAFYIYQPYGEIYFIVTCGSLMLVYCIVGYNSFSSLRNAEPKLAGILAGFYLALLFFILAMAARVNITWSMLLGGMGLLLSIPFILTVLQTKKLHQDGKSISLLQFVVQSRNKAGILFIFFLSSALYSGLAYFSFIPAIENSDRPKAYLELIREAEAGTEKAADGTYRHEQYKKAMDGFLERRRK